MEPLHPRGMVVVRIRCILSPSHGAAAAGKTLWGFAGSVSRHQPFTVRGIYSFPSLTLQMGWRHMDASQIPSLSCSQLPGPGEWMAEARRCLFAAHLDFLPLKPNPLTSERVTGRAGIVTVPRKAWGGGIGAKFCWGGGEK